MRRRASTDPRAGDAVRAQFTLADLAGERLIGPRIAQRDDLVKQRGRPQVRILTEPAAHVALERREHIRSRRLALARLPLPVDIAADRLAITIKMTSDRRDRPSLLVERFHVHIFLLCEHGAGLLRSDGFDTISIGGAPLSVAEPPCHPGTRGGDFQ
jgi:hypothetical protein